jgi:hypothetical protein
MGHVSFWCVLMMLIYWVKSINTTERYTEALLDGSKEVGLEVNAEKNEYMLMYHHQNAEQNQYKCS